MKTICWLHRNSINRSPSRWRLLIPPVLACFALLPRARALTFPLKTDATGQADVSFTVTDSGLYQLKVRNVNHPIREYNASLNIETRDTLVIP